MSATVSHPTRRIQVWADIDEGIADFVLYLNTIPGVTTCASCQGTLGEGGPNPYRGYVMATWTAEAFERLKRECDLEEVREDPNAPGSFAHNWGYVYPRARGK